MYEDKVVKINNLLARIRMFERNMYSRSYRQELDDAEEILMFTLRLIEVKELTNGETQKV
jgi:hypothetical protein